MAHLLERARVESGRLGYFCGLCRQTWVHEPRSACPSVPAYFSWGAVQAAGLHTQTQWRALRRRVITDAQPKGAIPSRSSWYWLYGEGQTTPMRDASAAQRAVLERGRQTQRTCRRCGLAYESVAELNRRQICSTCIDEARARREQERYAEARALASDWARDLLKATDWVLLDTETTGLGEAEIVEIGIVASDGAALLTTYVRPTAPITPAATAIHGITDALVANAPSWPEVYTQIVEALQGKRIVAYNADFDGGMVARSCLLHGLADVESRWVDLMEPYADWWGEWSEYWSDYRWQPLPGGGHRALDDCRAALAVLRRMAALETPALASQATWGPDVADDTAETPDADVSPLARSAQTGRT